MTSTVQEEPMHPGISLAKRTLLSRPHPVYVSCAPCFRDLVKASLPRDALVDQVIVPPILPDSLCVSELRYRELLTQLDQCLVAENIWMPILKSRLRARSEAGQIEEVRAKARSFPWSAWFGQATQRALVTALSQKSALRNAALLRGAFEDVLLPAQATKADGLPLKVSLFRDTLEVFTPLCFEAWHRRGYKDKLHHAASLREDLAHGLILRLQARLGGLLPHDLYVPFCGSGTFAFEYLSLQWQLGHATVGRHDFFEASPIAPQQSLAHVRKRTTASLGEISKHRALSIRLEDTCSRTLAGTTTTWQRLCQTLPELATSRLHFHAEQKNFFESDPTALATHFPGADKPLCVLLNPPFGKRLETKDSAELYGQIAQKLAALSDRKPLAGLVLAPGQSEARRFTRIFEKEAAGCHPRHETLEFPYGTLPAQVVLFSASRSDSEFRGLQKDASHCRSAK